jgi:predicted nucleotidyltransferase
MDKKEIIAGVEERVRLISKKKIVAVYLFGSVAEGRSGPMSDIDVCIVDSNISWDEKLKIMGSFGDEYDVSFFSDLPVWIKMRALKGIPVIVNDRNTLYDFSFDALAEYEDIKPLLQNRIFRRFGKCTI